MDAKSRKALGRRLKKAVSGDVLIDPFSRGRYATDASAYQMMPAAVVVAKDTGDIAATLAIAREFQVPVTPRGAGTSQCGQAINSGIILDVTRQDRMISVDAAERTCVVEPGIVLDDLNRALASTGLWFPVDISTASRATLGGMAGNNACGTRSIRYGTMRDNVSAIDAYLADGTHVTFNDAGGDTNDFFKDLVGLGAREAEEIEARIPKVQRRVGGYNLDALVPGAEPPNFSHLLVGSEGTLAVTTRLKLRLSPRLKNTVVGICHFGSFRAAMEAVQHLVRLEPVSLELMDRTMISLGRGIAIYREALDDMIRGDPAAVLLAEFAEAENENRMRLDALADAMSDLGHAWDRTGAKWGGVVAVTEPEKRTALAEVRKSGLNIMMSMKEAGKPVSFIEDCAVPLKHLADYTERLTELFAKHGTSGTWYAHASVGCLHVRPVLNLKLEKDVQAMRSIAEAAFALVREFKGSHSGEHGDGIVRSEFHEAMFGSRLVNAFQEVKDQFDPCNLLNPGKIVHAPAMDDRDLMRYAPAYQESQHPAVLDWSNWGGGASGFQGAVEMCNNNGACRKMADGVMCPSFRATREEMHSVRGRANSLRLALSGQLGAEAFASDDMAQAMSLCVSCKACRRECPTGIDMARMKIEVLHARAQRRGLSVRDRLIAGFPDFAPLFARFPQMMNLADSIPGLSAGFRRTLGMSPRRRLPRWSSRPFRIPSTPAEPTDAGERRPVALFADSFNSWLEPEILRAGHNVLSHLGYQVTVPIAQSGRRRLCCGRSHLAVGDVVRARAEMARCVDALHPLAAQGVPIVGLEPSCLLTFRDEMPALFPDERARLISENVYLLEEYLVEEAADRLADIAPGNGNVLVHTHCHQKAFGLAETSTMLLGAIPGLEATPISSGCCGMAGAFGYQAETYDISMKMGELALFPAVREAPDATQIAASGTSCRHQIAHGTGRAAVHPVQILAAALETPDRIEEKQA